MICLLQHTIGINQQPTKSHASQVPCMQQTHAVNPCMYIDSSCPATVVEHISMYVATSACGPHQNAHSKPCHSSIKWCTHYCTTFHTNIAACVDHLYNCPEQVQWNGQWRPTLPSTRCIALRTKQPKLLRTKSTAHSFVQATGVTSLLWQELILPGIQP